MIPADLASRLRQVTDDLATTVTRVTPTKEVTDVLSDLKTGQRILAEIQSLLPNGAYRAVVAQREITLALPFSAKPGDSLELEVQETEGKLTLALISNRGNNSTPAPEEKTNPSTISTFSKTGHLIGDLLSGLEKKGGEAPPAALNRNQPILSTAPNSAVELAPLLKDALAKSGVFYESHQAQWVAGKIPTAQLLAEPQGKLSTLIPQTLPSLQQGFNGTTISPTTPQNDNDTYVVISSAARENIAAKSLDSNTSRTQADEVTKNQSANSTSKPVEANSELSTRDILRTQTANPVGANTSPTIAQHISPELTPLVQQQLNALATQTYAWQGQVWPGQNMDWEITEDDGRPRSGDEEVSGQWQTRLKLNLPRLGGIDARIGLDTSGQLSLLIRTNEEGSKSTLTAAASQLEKSLQSSGLQLKQFIVTHAEVSA